MASRITLALARDSPAPYCARLSYTLPPPAQPRLWWLTGVMKPIVLIPARMAATRLPGKPLADIEGIPMIVRVLRQAQAERIGLFRDYLMSASLRLGNFEGR